MDELAAADPARDATFDEGASERLLGALLGDSPPPVRLRRSRWRGRGLLVAAILLAALVVATVALAAAGVFLTGSTVKPSGRPSAGVGEGLPIVGRSRLLPLRVPDPQGGLPWGLRIVHTTRGLVCVQVGRVRGDQLGELGIDGAFHDDGRFHPLPADVLPRHADSGHAENAMCQLAGGLFANEQDGIDRSAVAHEATSHAPIGDLRDIAYGLLGSHARSVRYGPAGAGGHTERVVTPSGAYLAVTMAAGRQLGVGGGTSDPGGPGATVQPSGIVNVASYSFGGRLCVRSMVASRIRACPPPPETHWPVLGAPRDLHEPISAKLELRGKGVADALVSFRAPYAVRSAQREYVVRIPLRCHAGWDGVPVNRDVARGSIVQVVVPRPFLNSCSSTVTFEVYYGGGMRLGPRVDETLVGSTALRLSPGTAASPQR